MNLNKRIDINFNLRSLLRRRYFILLALVLVLSTLALAVLNYLNRPKPALNEAQRLELDTKLDREESQNQNLSEEERALAERALAYDLAGADKCADALEYFKKLENSSFESVKNVYFYLIMARCEVKVDQKDSAKTHYTAAIQILERSSEEADQVLLNEIKDEASKI